MATEEEAREAADGEEVQVEAVDLGTTHLQMNLDRKRSSHEEIKGEAKIMDSTEGLLKVTEDQVLEKAPFSVEVPPEDTPNGTASSLNGHMEEAKISDEKPQENGQTDIEQVEASSNGISTDQSNNSNDEEAIDSSGHVESTTQDTSLLIHENEEPKEHYQQDVEGAAVEDQMVHEDTLQTDEPTVNAQQGQSLEPAEVIEDTKHASTSCIPHDEVVVEAPAGVQTSLEPNVDDSGALPDASDGNTEREHAKVEKESCPEDEDVAEQTNEIIKPEDQPSKQIDDVDADLVQEEVPKKTDVQEDTIKTEQVDESTNDDQDELTQESPEDTSDPVYEKTEETSHASNVSTSEETAPEHATTRETALDVQEVQIQGLAEEIEDAKEVDTKKTVQQSGVASEEASPEDNVATIEPSSDIQNLNAVESEEIKVLEDDKAEETSNQRNVIIAEDAAQDKESTEDIQPVKGLEEEPKSTGTVESTEDIQPVKGLEEEPKSTGTVEMDEVSNQRQADVLDNLAEEDNAPASQPQVIELEEEAKDTGVTETQEITQQSHVAASEELVTEDNSMAVESGNDDIQQTLEQGSVEVKDTEASETREICHETTISASEEDSAEDNVTAEGPTSDAQEVENRESVEEIKNNTDDNVEASAMATVEEADQENSMLPSEAVPEQHTRELEPEEVQSTEPVEPQGISPSHIVSTSEESTPEDNVTAEPSTDTQTENLESATITEEAKDVMSTDAIAEEETPDEHAQESEAPVHTPPVEEPELEETKNTDNQMDATILENPTHEDKPTASELLVMESPEVSSSEATEGQEMPKSEVTQSEDYGTEENTIAGEPKILEPELAEEMRDSEAAEPRSISQQSIVSSSEESVPEEDVTVKEPTSDIKEVQTEEPERIEEHNDEKAGEISNQSREIIVGETAQEKLDSSTATEETKDVESTDAIAEEESPEEHVQESEAPVDTPAVGEPELEETKNTEPAEVHDNVATNDLPAEEVNNTEATEIAEIQNESGDLTEDVKSNVVVADEAAPEEDAKATEATADIPQAQEPEQEEIKDSEPVEVEDDKIASDLAEEEIKDTEAMETELIPDESTSAKITELTNDVKSNVAFAEEAAPEEHVTETEATIDIPGAQEPELEEIKNTEPVDVKENISASDLPAKEVKETEVISESTDANISEPTEDAETNVALADEAALEEHVIATDATDDIPRAQEPELEETKNTEPIEMKENISASDLPAEEVKETEATETEVISKSTVANISEPTEDAETNVALADVAAPDEHAKATEATVDKPQAQDPDLEEIKNSEPIEVEDNIIASDLPEEEIKDTKAIETEVMPDESTSAKITEFSNDVKSNVALAEEAAPEEYVTEAEATIHIPGAQDPELEEIKNTEPVEVKENISASDLPAEEVKETEATETEVISESTDANISEPTEDTETNVALADKAAPEANVIATEATVDIPRAQEAELEEIENAEHVEVEENISANDPPAEENFTENEPQMTDIESAKPEPTPNESNVASLEEMATEDNTTILTDVTIQQLQQQEPVEFRDTEATSEEAAPEDDVMTEVSPDTQAENLESAAVTEETKDVKSTDTIAEEETPEHVQEFESLIDIPTVEQPELEETKNTEPVEVHDNVMTNDLPAEEVKDTQATEIAEIHNESGDLTEDVKTNVALTDKAAPDEDAKATEPTADIPQAEEPELQENKNSEPVEVEDNIIAREMPEEEIKDTEAMETEMIPDESTGANISEITDDVKSNVALVDEAAPEEHVIATEATIDVPRAQEPKLEEIKNTEPVEVEENISATDQSAEETEATEAMESEAINDSIDANNSDATECEEASHPNQDAGLEKLVSESNAATLEPTADIQQVSDLDVVEEMTAAEAINDEEISCKKTEVATLEDQSPTELDKETLVNEINNAEPTEQKDESSDLGEKAAFTTPEGEGPTEEDAQTSGEDTVGISNNIEQIKEQSNAVIEQDAIQSADHTNDQDDEQLHNAELQMEVCERSLDVSALEQPDEDVQKVSLDQQQNEDEAIEKQTEEIQRDEQKHDGSSADLTTETLLEPQSSEIGTTNLHEDTDVFEAEQRDTVATEMLMNEQTPHTPQGSIPSIADVKVEDSTEIEEMPQQENAPNNTYTDAEADNYNEGEKESVEVDAAVAELSTDDQNRTTDETINEEVGNGLASPIEKDLEKTSDPAPSKEEMLENNPTVVPRNVEPTVDEEEKECINKANDDMQAIQASEEKIVDEVEKKQEMQSEDTDVNNDVQTKTVDEETSELHSNDNTDNKMDDTMSPYAEMVHGRIDAQPREIEEVEENSGFSSISEYALEQSKQNAVDQDLSIHPKVVGDHLEGKQNGAEVETNSNEEMVTSYTAVTEAVKYDEAINDKASGADRALSDENLKTIEDNRRNLEASSVVTASGESNEDKEHHNLALPAYSGVDGNTNEQASGSEVTERGLLFSEKPLPTESEEHEESQTTKEQDEEDIHEQETGDTEKEKKEDEQSELPVSNFLMNLIMGKESTEPDEAEKKQEETTKDDSCLITSQLEENLVPIPTESKVDNKLIFEQGKHNLEGSEETHDFKLESDDVLSTNTHNLEAPVCENNVQGEVSSELVPGGSGLMTELETRDVKLGEKATNSEEGSLNNNLDDSTNPKVSQEDTLEEGRTDLQHESLPEDISSDAVAGQTFLSREPNTSDENKLPKDNDDLQSPLRTKREEATESSITEAESTVKAELENEVEKDEEKQHTTDTGGGTEGQVENLHDNSQKGTEAAIPDEQKAEITEPVTNTELNLVHAKEISAGSECEEETQNSKLSDSELHNSEKALDIQSDDSSLHINQDKQDECAGDQIVMEKTNLLDKPGESNLHEEQETEIGQESPKESDGVDQNCLAITEPVIKEGNANTTAESHVPTVNTKSSEEQEILMSQVQERGLDVVSGKEAPEAEEDIVQMAKPKFSTDEEQVSKEDKSNMAGEKTCVEKTKDEEKAKSSTDEVTTKVEEQGAVQKASHNQTRDLNVVLPTEAPGSEESFVDVKTPEFSTDEEQSPKKDESNMSEEKSYDEKTNSTDEAPTKIEEREAGQKASPKKHNILSGVGSKVKHQLAKVKKAIIGKPGHTKSESPKS